VQQLQGKGFLILTYFLVLKEKFTTVKWKVHEEITWLRPYCTYIGEKFLSSTTKCFMIHKTFLVPFMLMQTFSLYMISNPNALSSHSQRLPAEMPNQEYIHTGVPRNP